MKMSGRIEFREHITRDMLRAEPDALFVFGDNLLGRGTGGQAAEMRGEPNAVGIATKVAPHMGIAAFFKPSDLDLFKDANRNPLRRIAGHIRQGGKVVWPKAGIGTGRAQLREKAPQLWRHLQACERRLRELAGLPTI
jgi:hypothetical protein